MTDEKTTITTLETPPLCMVDYFAGRESTEKTGPVTARVVSRHGNVIEIEIVEGKFAPVPKTKARRLTSKWEEAAILILLAACAAAGVISLLRP